MKLRKRIVAAALAVMLLGGAVTMASILPNTIITSEVSAAGTAITGQAYTITASDWLALRSGAGTSYSLLKKIPKGSVVNVTKYNSNKSWGYTTYDGKSGWICLLAYAKKCSGTSVSNGTYGIVSYLNTAKGIDIAGSSKENRGNAILYTFNAKKKNQQFKIQKVSGEWYTIVNVNSGKALDVPGGETKNGTNVAQWTINKNPNQLWRFIPAGNGYYYIQSRVGTFMHVYGGKATEKANIAMWECNGKNCLKFKLVGINPVPTTVEAKIKAQQKNVVNYLEKKKIGTDYTAGYCLQFVEEAYENCGFDKNVGINRPGNDCAYISAVNWRKSSWKDAGDWKKGEIPIGASVFIDNNSKCESKCYKHGTSWVWRDHIGIYVGNGKVAHVGLNDAKTKGIVRNDSITRWKGYKVSWGFVGVERNSYSANTLLKG